MIRDKIQNALSGIVSSYSPSVNTDNMPAMPFAVHDEKIVQTFRDKEAIYGFEYEVGVMIVGESDSQIDPICESVTETMEMLSDDDIDQVEFSTSTGIQYDAELNKFTYQLTFRVFTNNL